VTYVALTLCFKLISFFTLILTKTLYAFAFGMVRVAICKIRGRVKTEIAQR